MTKNWVHISTTSEFTVVPMQVSAPMASIGGEFTVYNHLVTSGLWMWYGEYLNPHAEKTSKVNHCATVLASNFMEKKEVYSAIRGPVFFTSVHGGALSERHIEQLRLFAGVAAGLEWRLNYHGNIDASDAAMADVKVSNALKEWSVLS